MATTITSYPSALSLAGNIAPVRVTASETFRFKLSKGSSVLLEEDYTPDASGYAEIDIRDIVLSDLYLSLPSSDVFCQSAAAASYTISAGVDSKTFTGVLCGVDRPATDAATFLLANFLTWQPQIKAVQYNQPEWLSFFVSSAQTSLKVRFYKKDGTTADVVVADSRSFDPNRVYSVNMQFARIWALGDGDRYGMFDAWLEDDQGTKLTYTQRYVLDTSSDDRTLFVTRNSLGGLDTFVLHGSVELASEAEHTNVMRARLLAAGTIDGSRTYSVNTGLLSLHEAKWMQDILRSQQSWVLLDGALRSIVLLSPSVTSSSIDDSSGTVDFMLCDDDGYLNIARTDVAPEAIEVPGPDGGEVFFLAPRLIEYPDASLEDSWLIPLQSGFEEKWYKASLGGIRSYVAGYLEDTYGRLWHGHDNLAVLDKFGIDASGALTWNGNPVGSGTNAGDFVTLATDQTITGRKRFDADAVFATKLYVPSTAGAAVYDVFIDDNGAVSGETPSAGGEGLDIDAMWSELAADDASRAIHLSHIPLIPWGNISGRPTTLQGYGLQTEADNRYVRLVDGMGLSSNDYTDGEKEKLSGIAVGAQVNVLESVKLNGSLLQVTSKAVNVNAVTSLSVPTGLSAGDMTSAGEISVSLATGYVIPKNTAKFWGRTWNGLADVSGAIEGATDIDASGTVYAATAIRTNKLYVPSTSGNNVYDIYVDDSGTVSGEVPAAGEGLDIEAMWEELASDDASRVINLSHIPLIPWGNVSGIPSTFTPSSHSHKKSDISDFPTTWAWSAISGKPDTFTPSAHNQAWSTITDTPSTLEGYGITDAYSKTDADERYLLKSAYTASDVLAKLLTVDGTGSKLDADLLDGTHKADLFSALSSNATTNLSVTIGGTTKSIADLYATYADKLRTARTLWGQSFKGDANVSGDMTGVGSIDASGTIYAATAIRTNKLYVPSTSGNNIYDIFIDDSGAVSGEAPAAGEGLDIDAMWEELASDDASRVINLSHIPLIPWGNVSGIPSAFTPSSHSHKKSDISDFPTTWAWSAISGKPETFTPSDHKHTVSQLSDLGSTWDAYLKAGIYERSLTFNGTSYPVFCDVSGASVVKWYAPVAAGTAGQWLKATGGVPVWANDGSGSGLDADMLDGVHLTDIFRANILPYEDLDADELTDNYTLYTTTSDLGSKDIEYVNFPKSKPAGSFFLLTFKEGAYKKQIYGDYNDNHLHVRSTYYLGGSQVFKDWSKIAFTDDNVASATKLQTARTLWGQSFNGTANVSGNLSSVGTINSTSFYLGGGQLLLYNSSSKNYRLSQNYDGSVARIYNVNADGVGYQDLSLGQTQTNAGALYFDASALMWGLGTTTPAYKLDIAGTFRATGIMKANGGFVTTKLYIPASAGNQVYDLYIDDTGTVSGEAPAAGEGGIDIDAMWEELAADDASRTIHLSHIPLIPWANVSSKPSTFTPAAHNQAWSTITGRPTTLGGYGITDAIKDGENIGTAYIRGLQVNGSSWNVLSNINSDITAFYAPQTAGTSGYILQSTGGVPGWISRSDLQHQLFTADDGCLSIPANADLNDYTTPGIYYCRLNATVATWTNSPTSYACSLIVLAAAGVIQILREYGYSSSAKEFTRRYYDGAWTSWQTSINSANYTSYPGNMLRINPNNSSHTTQDSAVPANGRFAVYDVDATTTTSGGDGYIMSFRWPSGNWCTQLYLDVDTTGIMALRHRNSSSVWTEWYRILHSGNYSSYLDSRYLRIGTSAYPIAYRTLWTLNGTEYSLFRSASGNIQNIYAPNAAGTSGQWLKSTGGIPVWASDGSGSGLDADLLDGKHNGSVSAADAQWLKELAQIGSDYTTVKAGKDRLAELISSQGEGIGYPIRIGASFISHWDDEDASTYASSVYEVIKIGGGYRGSTYGQWLLSSYNLTNIGVVGRSNNAWSTIKWLAFTTDNVASATKLQTARTLWGRSFDGTENVSGAISSTGSITPSAGGSYNIGTSSLWYERIYGRYIDTASGYNLRLCTGGTEHISIQASNGYVGINNTSPAYQLDVAGSIYATDWLRTSGSTGWYSQTYGGGWYMTDTTWVRTYNSKSVYSSGQIRGASGLTISDDFGWFSSNGRLAAGLSTAKGVNVGSLLISPAWADYTKVPTYGLYCKGDIWTGGKLYIPSTSGNNVYDIYLDENGIVSGETPGTDTLDKIIDLDPSWQPVLQEEPALLFAGRVSSTGTVTKYAGTGTLACSRSATGIYALTLKDDSQNTVSLYSCCVTATALYTSSTSAAYICTTNYVSSVYSVKISNLASGALANCAFNIVIFK